MVAPLWIRLLIFASVGYLAWCLLLYLTQDSLLFPIAGREALPARPSRPGTIMLAQAIDGGRVVAWLTPPPDGLGPVVVFFHGNAETIEFQDDIVDGYQRLGCGVLLPEYRGYGLADGKPTEDRILADAAAFFDQLIARRSADAERVVFHGRSVGGGFAVGLTTRRRPRALIVESTFTSVAAMARGLGAPSFLIRNPMHTDQILAASDLPTLLFHGTRDAIVPVTHGRRLRDLCRNATYVEYPVGHNDLPGPLYEQEYWDAIESFLRQSGVLNGPSQP